MGEEKCKIAVYLVITVDFNIFTVAAVFFLESCLAQEKREILLSSTLLLHVYVKTPGLWRYFR